MASAVPPTTSGSLWRYLDPRNILNVPIHLYRLFSQTVSGNSSEFESNLEDRNVVVIRTTDDPEPFALIGNSYQDIFEYFSQATNPYPLREIFIRDPRGESIKLEIPIYFLSDLERSGVKDRFFLDGKELTPPPKTEKQKEDLLTWMLKKADGNSEKVKRWASLWNLRAKFVLVNHLRREIHGKYGLDPSMNALSKSVTTFNTVTGELSCSICGSLTEGTSQDLDPKIFARRGEPIQICYQARLTYDVGRGAIEEKVEFFDEPV